MGPDVGDIADAPRWSASSPLTDLRALRSVDEVPHNLPEQLTSFVGREQEMADVAQALSATRVLTLTGTGGCGKSRLALQTTAELLGRYPDGAWWVELASLSDPSLVAPALAQIFGVRPLPGQNHLEAVVAYIAFRRALLVLDNCEHLLKETARVTEALVRGCPDVTVLATSREPLGVSGEIDWRVPSLSLPAQGDDGAPGPPEASDAARLFAERAAEVRSNLRMSAENGPVVARICRALDGIPLAIELAAARVRVLSLEQIDAGLSDRFWLLADGTRAHLPRHRTLRASVDWSHELLGDGEQALFRRLGVFAGGLTLDAAEQVGAGEGVERKDVLDLLTGLIDKSLVQAEQRGSVMRYRLLETIRQYALERLEEAGETERVRDRHRDAYLDMAERMAPDVLTPRQPEVLDLLDLEAANFTQAIERAVDTEPEKALRLCVSLVWWYRLHGRFVQGEADFRRALEGTGTEPSVLRARGLWGRAHLLTFSGAVEAAFPAAQEALAEAERVGDPWSTAGALADVGLLTMYPDPVAARIPLERGRKLATATGDDIWILGTTQLLGSTYMFQDDPARAVPLYEEVLPIAERMGYRECIAWYWSGVAYSAYLAADRVAGREAAERMLEAARSIDDVVTETTAAFYLALGEVAAGEHVAALARLRSIRERALARGSASAFPWLEIIIGLAYAMDGRLEEARSAFQTAIDITGGGFAHAECWARVALAETLWLLGDADGASAAARRGLELAERIDNRLRQAQARLVLARLAARRGNLAEAQRLGHEALSAIVDGGYRVELPRALEVLAEVAAGLESHAEAARILGATRRPRGQLEKQRGRQVDPLEATVRAVLGTEAFEEAFAAGEALSLDEAVAYVRRARGSRKRPPTGWESLTPTELEVARHTAAGLTNPEIGQRMFISRGTVKFHLSHIYGKLGLHNRSELAAETTRRLGLVTPLD